MKGAQGGRAPDPSAVDLNQPGFIKFREVRQVTGLSRTSVWRMERRGEFPARRLLSARSVGWLASEIRMWIETRRKCAYTREGASDGKA